ncbi:MAG: hypothetical protein CMC96_01795 [Flavobacteriales bacterium]|nr:hypothetical protein [Flavobacteriales bacterium]|tara:strand:- start:35150 stop:36214 length:1065 start_codon:yes stop_codon:yes gene_type:complete
MSKTIKYAGNGALIGAIGFLTFNLFNQLTKNNDNPNFKFDWKDFLISGGKGALIGGTAGAFIGGVKDTKNSMEEPLNTSSILRMAVHNMKLNKLDQSFRELSNKAKKITCLISSNFQNKLGGHIVRIGSTEDNTALAEDYDIDISIPFAPKSFSSTSVMYDELYNFIEEKFNDPDLIKIRAQKKSIGLLFEINGEYYKIDIVPYKLSQSKGNKSKGYLFVNNDSLFQRNSYTKTDISSLKGITLSPVQQKIHIALKTWKRNFDIPISSHLIKILLLDAYKSNKGKIPRSFTDKLLMVMLHIRNEIHYKRIVSVENTNNVLTDINDSIKNRISKSCDKVLDDYEYQPNSILNYFA